MTRSFVFLNKYYLGDQIKKNEMAGHVARMRERRDAWSILMGDLRVRRKLGRIRR